MLGSVQEEEIETPLDWVIGDLASITGFDAAQEVLRQTRVVREDINRAQKHESLLGRGILARPRRDKIEIAEDMQRLHGQIGCT